MTLGMRAAVATSTATVVFGAQLRHLTTPRNRMLGLWDTYDAIAITLGILVLAIVFLAVHSISARRPLLNRVMNHLFVFTLVSALISTLLTYSDYKSELAYWALTAVVAVSFCRPELKIPAKVAKVAVAFFPIFPLSAYQLFTYPKWAPPPEVKSEPLPEKPASPIYVIICDEWSFARSFENGKLRPLFKNVSQFANQAITFTDARTPGPRTDESIPRFIFQREDSWSIMGNQLAWNVDGKPTPSTKVSSIFADAKSRGYRTSLVGFYLPYRRMLGDQIDSVTAYNAYVKPEQLLRRSYEALINNVSFQLDPVSKKATSILLNSVIPGNRVEYSHYWERINRSIQSHSAALIRDAAKNQFSFIHLPLPHCPWIFNAEGAYLGPYKGKRFSHDRVGYENHLAYMDSVLGKFLAAIRAAGDYDDAMIVIASDHSWRLDYTYDDKLDESGDVRHVPMFIKLPKQESPLVVKKRVEMISLRPVFSAVMDGDLEKARELLRDN